MAHEKDIWDKKLTVHITLPERINQVLVLLSAENGVSKGRMIEEMILQSEDFVNYLEKMREEGWDF